MTENGPSWVARRRWWLVAGALVIAVVVLVVVIIVPGNGLMTPDRVVTGQETSEPGDDLRNVWIDEATGIAYFSYLANGRRRLAAYEAGSGTPLWTVDTPGTFSSAGEGATSTDMTLSGDAVLLLVEQGGSTAMGGSLKGVVFGLPDLKLRWEHEGRVTSIADGLFYAGSSNTGRQVLDAQGRELWRPNDEVQVGRSGSTWGYIKFSAGFGEEKPPDTDLFTYYDLATGNRLASSNREHAWFDTAGVLQMARAREPQYWFLSLPDGDTTSLGDLPVVWQDCAYSHTYIACFDNDGKPGMWRYRD